MQLRFATDLSAEEYVRREAWKEATLESCPVHPEGGCGFRKNGTYSRRYPEGTKIARWYCAIGHQTFSFLPDCLSARLSGALKEVEKVVEEVEKSPSQEDALERIRLDIFLPGALRWVRRRILPIRSALTMLIELVPSMFWGCEPTLSSFRCALCVRDVLPELRQHGAPFLQILPPPLGFGSLPAPKKIKNNRFQHKTGTDPPYLEAVDWLRGEESARKIDKNGS
jgi:hypothetical protein